MSSTNTNSSIKPHKKLRLIAIDETNYNALRMLGRTPDSFNTVITRLLEEREKLLTVGGSN
jgi:predicted CopG family antitoxin